MRDIRGGVISGVLVLACAAVLAASSPEAMIDHTHFGWPLSLSLAMLIGWIVGYLAPTWWVMLLPAGIASYGLVAMFLISCGGYPECYNDQVGIYSLMIASAIGLPMLFGIVARRVDKPAQAHTEGQLK